jgi:thioredoxin 1
MLDVDKENFAQEVLEADKPVIVDFWGPSCQPCLKLMPDVEALEQAYGDQIKIVK